MNAVDERLRNGTLAPRPLARGPGGPLAALRRLARGGDAAERCDVCSTAVDPGHDHLLEVDARRLLCSCAACALLFDTAQDQRYRRIPRRLLLLPGFDMSDAEWEGLAIPVGMAFLCACADGAVRAWYPSPAGATESLLPLDGWRDLVERNPALRSLEHDVEALLINRVGTARDHVIAPIDACFELVGLIRLRWRGLSGGQEVWERIDAFFTSLRERAEEQKSHA